MTASARKTWLALPIGLSLALVAADAPAQADNAMIQCVITGRCPTPPADPLQRDGFALQLASVFHLSKPYALPMPQMPTTRRMTPEETRQMLAQSQANRERHDDPVVMLVAGNQLAIEGSYPKAQAQYEAALALVADGRDLQAQAAAFGNLGAVIAMQGRYAEARDKLQQSLQAYAALVATPVAPANSAAVPALEAQLARLGIDPRAVNVGAANASMAGVANEMERRMANAGVVRATINLANLAGHLGQYADADAHLQRALLLARQVADQDESRMVLVELAVLYRKLGKDADAAGYRRRAEQAPEGASRMAAGATLALGSGGATLAAAEPRNPEGVQKRPSHYAEAGQQSLQAEAEAAERAGHSAAAMAAYGRAAIVAMVIGNPERERAALASLQRLHETAGHRELAIFYGKRAVNATQRLRGNLGALDRQARQAFLADKRRSYASLARLLLDADRLAEAEQVLRLLKEDEGQQFRAATAARGMASYSLREAGQVASYERIVEQTRSLEDERSRLRDSGGMMSGPIDDRAAQEQFRVQQLAASEHWLKVFEGMLAQFDASREKVAAIAAKPASARSAQERKMLADYPTAMGFIVGRIANLGAGLRALRRDSALFVTPLAPADSARIVALEARAADLEAKVRAVPPVPGVEPAGPMPAMPPFFAAIFGAGATAMDRYWAIDRELEALDATRASLDAAVGVDFANPAAPTFGAADQAILESGRQLLGALPAGTVALYYLVGDRQLDVLLVGKDVRRAVHRALPRTELEQRIQAYRVALQNRNSDPLPAGRELYDLLVAPLAGALRETGARTLMLALDGQLRYLPFAALHDGQGWLAERFALDLYTTAAPAALASVPAPKWRVAAFGSTVGGAGFAPLPGVRLELDGIVRDPQLHTQGVLPGVIKLDRDFTAAALRSSLRERQNVVHIASHFAFQPGDADASFLLLGDGRRLTLAELGGPEYRFDQVDLVTLSACQTGLSGDDRYGQEVEGMGTLLQGQGAAAVLATLWEVADAGTADFMRQLYAVREQRGLSRAQAVRETQIAFIRGARASGDVAGTGRGASRPGTEAPETTARVDPARPYAHPYFWAPFVLMGNWL